MSDIEARRKFILEGIGKEELNILRESGIDIDSGITKILQRQHEKQATLKMKADFSTVSEMMTSELAYKSNSFEDIYGREFTRRFGNIGFTNEQILGLYQMEQLILSVDEEMGDSRRQPWVMRYFLMPDSAPETLPKKEHLTLSELILITDDATSAFVRDHYVLSDKAWAAVCVAAVQAHNFGGAQYSLAFKDRVKKLGWFGAQEGAFIRNECLLTERMKWGYHDNPAWTSETCDLKQYQG